MSWRTAATLLIIVFVLLLLQATLAGPAVQISDDLNATGDYDNDHFNGNDRITGYVSDWFNMGLVAVFGMMLWGVARVIRRELTRGGGGGGGSL